MTDMAATHRDASDTTYGATRHVTCVAILHAINTATWDEIWDALGVARIDEVAIEIAVMNATYKD